MQLNLNHFSKLEKLVLGSVCSRLKLAKRMISCLAGDQQRLALTSQLGLGLAAV